MERLQAEWQENLLNAWKDMLEDFPVPAFVSVSGGDGAPLANTSLKALLPVKSGFSVEMEPTAPVYAPFRAVSFMQNGRKTRELMFDIFSVPAFTVAGHRTITLGLKRERGDKPDSLTSFAACLLKFYDTGFMPRAVDMLNVLPVGAAIMDERGDFVYASRSLAAWNGVSALKIQGMSAIDFSDGAVTVELLDGLVRGAISGIEWSSEKDGETMFSAIYRHSAGLLAQVAALSDDNAARETAREASERRNKLEETVNRAGTVIFVLAPDKDWRFSYVSENIERFGISRDDGSAARLGEHIEDFERFKSKARRALANCCHYRDSFNLISDGGAVFRMAADMRIVNADGGVRIEGSLTDITPLEALRQQAMEACERLKGGMLEQGKTEITDVVTPDFLQENQNRFAEVFMLPSQIFDSQGKEITKSYGNCSECSLLCGVTSNRACKLWNLALAKFKDQPDSAAVVSCPKSSVTAAFFPVYVDKHLSAVWKIGAVLLEQISEEDISSISESFGTSIRKTSGILRDFPRCVPQTFRLAVETLSILARNISAYALNCIKLSGDVGATDTLHSEVEKLLEYAGIIGNCVERVSDGGSTQEMLKYIGITFGFDRLKIYTERVISDEWMADGVLPSHEREVVPERWKQISKGGVTPENKALSVCRPIWHEGSLFALVCAERCLERRELSESELELLSLMLAAAGELVIARRLGMDESAAVVALEDVLGGMTVLDYNTHSVLYPHEKTFEGHEIPYDDLVDDDGNLSAPVAYGDGECKAVAFRWHDGRLAVLVKDKG